LHTSISDTFFSLVSPCVQPPIISLLIVSVTFYTPLFGSHCIQYGVYTAPPLYHKCSHLSTTIHTSH
jgi:hypothetical protein